MIDNSRIYSGLENQCTPCFYSKDYGLDYLKYLFSIISAITTILLSLMIAIVIVDVIT